MEENKLRNLYLEYHLLYKRAHPNLSKGQCQEEANLNWKSFQKAKGKLDIELYKKAVSKLKAKLAAKKSSMFDYVLKPKSLSRKKSVSEELSASMSTNPEPDEVNVAGSDKVDRSSSGSRIDNGEQIKEDSESLNDGCDDDVLNRKRETPSQDKLKEELKTIDARLVSLNEARNLGLGEENNSHLSHLTKQIKELTLRKEKVNKSLKRNKSLQKSSQKYRTKNKKALERALKDFPGLENTIKMKGSAGRPPLEDVYPSLHADILNIATVGAASSEKRREDLFRSVKSTDQLHSALDDLGYRLSKTALYYRLLPKNSRSSEGKRHVKTVPVRLVRPENNLRRKHPDRMFAAESYNSCFKIVETLGPLASIATSFDDKAAVHIGVTAAKRQGPMLMNMR